MTLLCCQSIIYIGSVSLQFMFKFSFLLRIRFYELFLWIHCHEFSVINSISRIRFHKLFLWIHCHEFSFINSISWIRFHELICQFVNIPKSSYEFAGLCSGSFLPNQCQVANGLYCKVTFVETTKTCFMFTHRKQQFRTQKFLNISVSVYVQVYVKQHIQFRHLLKFGTTNSLTLTVNKTVKI